MDEARITRPSPPSTRTIVADEGFCGQVAALLMCDRGPIHDAFIGEPVEEVLEMVRWALSREDDEGFDTAEVLISWAKKRGRGTWSGRPPRPPRSAPRTCSPAPPTPCPSTSAWPDRWRPAAP